MLANKHEHLKNTRYCAPLLLSFTSNFENEITKWVEAPLGLPASGLSDNRKFKHLLETEWALEAFLLEAHWVVLATSAQFPPTMWLRRRMAHSGRYTGPRVPADKTNLGSPSRTTIFQRKLTNKGLPNGLEIEKGDPKIQKLRAGESFSYKIILFTRNAPEMCRRASSNNG